MPSDYTSILREKFAGSFGAIELSAGDLFTAAHDLPAGVTYTLTGKGGWKSDIDGDSQNRGTQLVATSRDQPYIIRVGGGTSNRAGASIAFRDFSFWGIEGGNNTIGLNLAAHKNFQLTNVGFSRLAVGLRLYQEDKPLGKMMTTFRATSCEFNECATGIHVRFGDGEANANTVIDGADIRNGGIGIDVENTGRGLTLRDCYAEAQSVAGVVVRSGRLTIAGGYYETDRRNMDDIADLELVPSIAIMDGAAALLSAVTKVSWLYLGDGASFGANDFSTLYGIGYVVLHPNATDNKITEVKSRFPVRPSREKHRVLIADKPWSPGEKVKVRPA